MTELRPYSVQLRYGGATTFVWTFIERSVSDVLAKVGEMLLDYDELPPIGSSTGVPSLILEIRSP